MIIPPIGPVRLLLFSMRKCVTGNASPGDVIASPGAQGLMGSGVPIVYNGRTGLASLAELGPRLKWINIWIDFRFNSKLFPTHGSLPSIHILYRMGTPLPISPCAPDDVMTSPGDAFPVTHFLIDNNKRTGPIGGIIIQNGGLNNENISRSISSLRT